MFIATRNLAVELFKRFFNCKLRLFTNDYFPSGDDHYDHFKEPYDPAYVPIKLRKREWKVEPMATGAIATYAEQTFNISVPNKIYGYFVTKRNNVLWSERFASGPFVAQGGERVDLTPQIKLE